MRGTFLVLGTNFAKACSIDGGERVPLTVVTVVFVDETSWETNVIFIAVVLFQPDKMGIGMYI